MPLHTYIVSVDYKEPDQSSYSAVEVSIRGSGETLSTKRFSSGNPENDWKDTFDWIDKQPDVMYCMLGSSCDHFVMDGDSFGWDYDEYGRPTLTKLLK